MSVDLTHACYPVLGAEEDAIANMVRLSPHTLLVLLPTHHLDANAQLRGFTFYAHEEDLARVLPITPNLFEATCVYEVCRGAEYDLNGSDQKSTRFNENVLTMLNDLPRYQERLEAVLKDIPTNTSSQASLACMPDVGTDDSLLMHYADSLPFTEGLPTSVGIYHAFVHSHVSCQREHKFFIVVSGNLAHAGNELYNLWHDCKENLSCTGFVSSEEVHWLRTATIRSLNRVACRIADGLELSVRRLKDFEDPNTAMMAIPTTISFKHDIRLLSGKQQVQVVNGGCFTDTTSNGIVFDTLGSDGLWLFTGPVDYTDGRPYGAEFCGTEHSCFPTETAVFHDHFRPEDRNKNTRRVHETLEVLQPDELFMQSSDSLGFNRNNQIVHLLEIISCSMH